MFIGACLELSIVTGLQSYTDDGIKACEFMMNFRNYNGGVFFLNENGQGDGGLFKGIFAKYFTAFIRRGNLTQAQKDRYMRMIYFTGNYVWNNAVNKTNYLINSDWSTLPNSSIDLSTQASGVHLFESIASLNKVHVYQNINNSGFYSQLPFGAYTQAQLQARGVTDNDITSLTIPMGYVVTVYENDNFTGASKTFTANTTWLADWNDRITSLKIVNIKGPVNVYQNINFTGYATGLEIGDYTLTQLQARGIEDNDITAMKIAQGFKMTIYDGDNFTGASAEFTSDTGWIGATWNDKVSSLRVRANGTQTLGGIYQVQNRNSNLYMDVDNNHFSEDAANIQQWTNLNATNQQFTFTHLGEGIYKILSVKSGKAVDVSGVSTADGANVQQWNYVSNPNQQFILVPTDNGYYKIIAKHSSKLVEVSGFSTASGGNVQQWSDENQISGQWKLIPVSGVASARVAEAELLHEEEPSGISISPNPVSSKLSVQGINDLQGIIYLAVYNSMGLCIKTSSGTSVDVDNLNQGVYFLKIKSRDINHTYKFIKQ
jgi:hypothetical protein